jgi:putative DNA primase/helicase
VLDRPGYDPATGLIYEPSADFPPLPAAPTLEDARRAVDVLYDLIADFPFLDACHRAVWLAAFLTVLGRPAVEGPTPLFLFDATTAGSGKTLLVKLIAMIATGREPAVSGLSDNNEETRKNITAIALAGERLVLLDNASEGFGCKALDAALTATVWRDRILGHSKRTGDMPLTTVWTATGNNVKLRGDTHRRVIPSRLESDRERPEERSDFKYPDLLGHVRLHRPELVVAGLTVLLAHLEAGRPKADLKHFGTYESWSDTIRQAVYWATGHDPWAARGTIAPESRDEADTLASILAAWRRLPGGDRKPGLTALQGLDCLKGYSGNSNPHQQLRQALMEWADKGDVLPSTRQIGNRFRTARGRVVAGMRLRSAEDKDHARTWFVEAVSGPQGGQGTGSAGSTGSVSSRSDSGEPSHEHFRTHFSTREGAPKPGGPDSDPADPAEPMTPGTPEPDDGGCDIPWESEEGGP